LGNARLTTFGVRWPKAQDEAVTAEAAIQSLAVDAPCENVALNMIIRK